MATLFHLELSVLAELYLVGSTKKAGTKLRLSLLAN